MNEWRVVIEGKPATKKTGQRIIRVKGQPRIIPAHNSLQWERAAVLTLQARKRQPTITVPVQVQALFYRRTNTTGDLHGYMQALADALEKAGVIENDRLICSWDGSRKLIDKEHPRVELVLRWQEAA